MKLSKITPIESTFKLRNAREEAFTMRPVNLADEIWLDRTYGNKIIDVFNNLNIKEISRIVFRLLKDEDKEFFVKRDLTIINEVGDRETMHIGGVELLQYLISGWDEKINILNALHENIGFSRPEPKEQEDEEEETDSDEKKSL